MRWGVNNSLDLSERRAVTKAMTHTQSALALVRHVLAEIGVNALSKLSGVPYTTLKDWLSMDTARARVGTLEKLETAAREYQSQKGTTK